MAVRRPRVAAARARALHDGHRRRRAGPRAARRRGRAARISQRLPPPRVAPAERHRRVSEGDPLPLPRLDLPARRPAHRRARGPLDPRARQVGAGPVPGSRRGDERHAVREPRHGCGAARRAGGRPARAPRALRLRATAPGAGEAQLAARQLEDRGGQLPRGLPRADRPPGADAAARLQELRRGAPRPLGLVQRAAARQAVRELHGAHLSAPGHTDVRPGRGGPSGCGASS